MIRAVFDTTVLISAFLRPGGVSDELLTLAGKEFAFLLSAPIIAETRRKLLTSPKIRKRYHYPDEAVERYVACSYPHIALLDQRLADSPRGRVLLC